MSNNQKSIQTNIQSNNKIPNQISLDTFYLTSLLLNYDISDQVYKSDEPNEIKNLKVVRRLFNIVLENKKYNMELLLNKFFEFVLWKNINLEQMIKMFCKKLNLDLNDVNLDLNDVNLDLNDENLEESKSSIEKYLKIIGERKIIFKPYLHDEIYKKVNKIIETGIIK